MVTGANRYNIFKLRSGLASFIGETTETSFTDDNIETNGSITPPLIRNPLNFTRPQLHITVSEKCMAVVINPPMDSHVAYGNG